MHGIIHGQHHRTFTNAWLLNTDRELNHDLRNADDITVPAPRFENFKRFPLYDFAKLWNNLGPMKYQNNFTTFNTWLKEETFRQLGVG